MADELDWMKILINYITEVLENPHFNNNLKKQSTSFFLETLTFACVTV